MTHPSPLEVTLLKHGTQRHLSGNSPVNLIQDKTGIWVVLEGNVDVFSTLDPEDENIYERQHLMRQKKGDGLLPIAPRLAPDGFKLTAVGTTGTKLVFVEHNDLSSLLENGKHDAQLSQIVDSWIRGWSEQIPQQQAPRNFTELVPDETVEAKSERPLHPIHDVVWIRSETGEGQFLGREDVPPIRKGTFFPLSSSTWVVYDEGHSVNTFSTHHILRQHFGPSLFESFHSTMVAARHENLLRDREGEKERRRQKRERDEEENKRSLYNLTSILHPKVTHLQYEVKPGSDPLVKACSALDQSLDMDLGLPEDTDGLFERSHETPLDILARHSTFRTRRVRLDGEWWHTDSGPLIAYKKDVDSPVALIPASDETYTLYDPEDDSHTRVDDELASTLQNSAHMLYRALPDRKLNGWDLVKFSAHGLRKPLVFLILMGCAAGLLALLTPILTGIIFDSIIPGAEEGRLFVFILGLFIAAISSTFFELTRNFSLLTVEGKMQGRLQPAIWDRVLNLPMPFFSEYTVGDLAQRAGGISTIRQTLSGATLTTILSSIFSVFSFFLLFYYSGYLALVAAALTVIAIMSMLTFGYFRIKYQREIADLGGRLSSRVLELIEGIAKIRVAGAEKRAFSRWAALFADKRQYAFRAGKINNYQQVFDSTFQLIGKIAIFAVVATFIITPESDGLTTGAFLAFMSAFGQFFSAGLAMASTVVGLAEVVPLYERARPILETTPEIQPESRQPDEFEGQIEMQGIDFRYVDDGPLILDNVSIQVNAGEMISLVGPSGSGKSTIMRLLLGFERPETGSIYFDGADLHKLDIRAVRRQIGVVLQNAQVQTGSIFKNIVGARPYSRDDAWNAARMCGLAEEIEEMPMGMDTHVSEGGGTLSGGQRQRLLIARALIHKPRIIFFDEATSALDNKTQKTVTDSLNKLDATRIVIAHRLSTIHEADHIYVVDEGRITERGTYDELMNNKAAFYELAKRQLA